MGVARATADKVRPASAINIDEKKTTVNNRQTMNINWMIAGNQ